MELNRKTIMTNYEKIDLQIKLLNAKHMEAQTSAMMGMFRIQILTTDALNMNAAEAISIDFHATQNIEGETVDIADTLDCLLEDINFHEITND